jgi:hypothetical protein
VAEKDLGLCWVLVASARVSRPASVLYIMSIITPWEVVSWVFKYLIAAAPLRDLEAMAASIGC